MPAYVFDPTTAGQQALWADPAVWSGGVVPDGTDADVTLPETAVEVPSVAIAAGQDYEVDTLAIDAQQLVLAGALVVDSQLSLADGAGIVLDAGHLSYDGLITDDGAIDGAGTVQGTGTVTLSGEYLPEGTILAAGGTLAVDFAGALTDGELNSGTYGVFLDGSTSGATLELLLDQPVTRLNATIDLGAASELSGPVGTDTVLTGNPANGSLVPLQDSLQLIDGLGTLNLDDQNYDSSRPLAVLGTLTLADYAEVSTTSLTVADGGLVSGSGVIVGPVIDDGTIDVLPGPDSPSDLYIDGPVSGSGVLVVGNAAASAGQDNLLELGGPVSASVQFGACESVVLLDDPEAFTGTITPTVKPYGGSTTATVDDYVLLAGLSSADVTSFTYGGNAQGGVLTLVGDGKTVTLDVAGDLSDKDFYQFAGPELNDGEPSLYIQITPELTAPTLGLVLPSGGTASAAIINTSTPTVTGIIPAGADISLTADGGTSESAPIEIVYDENPPPEVSRSYTDTLTAPLAAGSHEILAHAIGAGGEGSSDPLDLLVLPDPVNGITTATVSSFQFAAALDGGASMNFITGTEAIQLTDGTLSVGADTVQASVQRLYEGLLGRGGDTGGLEQFSALATASGTAAVADAIVGSPEFQSLHGGLNDTQLVTLLYNELLGRAPDPGGLANYVSALQGGASQGQVVADIADSAEAKTHLAADTANVWVPDATGALVTELYQTAFGRVPDPAGLAQFTGALQSGQVTAQQLAADLAASPEFLADHAGQGNAALVTSLYENGLGRAPGTADLQAWVGVSAASILFGVAASPEAAVHLIRNV